MPVSLSGIISGIDSQSIVDQIIAARAQPIIQLEGRISDEEDRKTALSDLRGRMSTLLTRIQSLTNLSTLNARTAIASTATASSNSVVGIAVDSTAALGTFTVSVEQLATASATESTAAIGQSVNAAAALDQAGLSGLATTVTAGTFTVQGTTTATITVAAGDSLTTVIGKINAETVNTGVTATLVGNTLQLDSGGGPTIGLGAGGDTSNFLAATHLLASPGTTTRTSTRALGQTQPDANLDSARLSTALAPTTGAFLVNGVSITYDATNESLNDVLDRINASGAGVTAVYDTIADKLRLTSESTGSQLITLSDTTGNFLAATGVLSATQTLGQNGAFKINGGATQYASSNVIADALPGVTLTLLKAEPGDNATVTVNPNDQVIVSAVSKFVEQYNSVQGFIADLTASDPDGESGDLARDSAIRRLGQSLRSLAVGLGDGLSTAYTSMGDVGVSFGAVGAEVGTTSLMLLDTGELNTAIDTDRNAVIQLFGGVEVSAVFTAGTGSIASATGTPDKKQAGSYRITDDGVGNLIVQFDPADGSTTIISSGTITAGGTNTTLIPGMTLTADAVLTAGADTIAVTRSRAGIAVKLADLMDAQLRADGVFDAKTENIDSRIEDMTERIASLEERLTAEQQRMERQFAQMEQVFARFQSQQQILGSLTATLQSLRPRRN